MYEKYYQQFLNQNAYRRELKSHDFIQGTSSTIYLNRCGQKLINFSSNDYLGLARHPFLIARSHEYAALWGVGAASSRLVSGNLRLYDTLEQQLATALGKPAALILGAGYQANMSVLEAILDARVLGQRALVFCDRYCHVSMLAMTQHVSCVHRFRHNDLAHLQMLLDKYAMTDQPKFILVESLYSMEGDQADLVGLIALAKQYQAVLYVDDAHAVGVYGPSGWGAASCYSRDIDVIMGTFSKALGSFGGYIACSDILKQYLVNKCRGLIYSTGISPAVLGAMSAAIELLPSLQKERQQLLHHAKILRQFFFEQGLVCGQTDTYIIPWIIGDAEKTLQASRLLEEKGILAVTIRPPTVPSGKSRIRFCLSASHSDDDMMQLMQAIRWVTQKIEGL